MPSIEFYERTVALKKAPGSRVRKVFLAIGGWNDSLGPKYSNMVMNRASRFEILSDKLLLNVLIRSGIG